MEMNINPEDFIPKFDAILARGLCAGLGARYDQMCIEAAVCAALNLPHGDEPICVARAVRSYKIKLNDANWSSPKARAQGLRSIGIAQVGSAGVVDDVEFSKRMVEGTIRRLIPTLYREVFPDNEKLLAAADRCELEGSREAVKDAAYLADLVGLKYATIASQWAVYAADAVTFATYYSANKVAFVAWAANEARKNTIKDTINPDKYLLLAAQICLEVLVELKSPGCEWL